MKKLLYLFSEKNSRKDVKESDRLVGYPWMLSLVGWIWG